MSAAAALGGILPDISEPWYAKPLRFANLPKAAEKVWACIKFVSFTRKSSTITVSDQFGAQWCSAHLGIHVGRRCFQKGLKQLEDIGAIFRRRRRGHREITITVNLAGPRPKPKPKARPSSTAGKAHPAADRPAPAPAAPPEPPPGPEELRQAAEALRAIVAQAQAEDQQQADATADRAQTPRADRATPTRRPRLHIPDAIRRDIEARERQRLGDELARLRAIHADRRTDDQERRIRGLASELGEPGTPPAPSGP